MSDSSKSSQDQALSDPSSDEARATDAASRGSSDQRVEKSGRSQEVQKPEDDGPDLMTKIKRVLIALGVILVVGVILSAFLPRWWAHEAGLLVHGSILGGFGWGIVFGILCTAIPIALLWAAFKARERAWLGWTFAVLALISALPNLMTLWVAVGVGSAAHAGQRTMDVEAPGFRGGTLTGVIIAAALIIFIIGVRIARHNKQKREAS